MSKIENLNLILENLKLDGPKYYYDNFINLWFSSEVGSIRFVYQEKCQIVDFYNKNIKIVFNVDRMHISFFYIGPISKEDSLLIENCLNLKLNEYFSSKDFEVFKNDARNTVKNLIKQKMFDYQISLKELSVELLLQN